MHSPSPGPLSPLSIVVSGATGLIGRPLVERLRARGHTVRRLVRSARDSQPGDIVWDPSGDQLDFHALEGTDAAIHLAGEPVAHRWTSERKLAIRESRVKGTSLLARTMASLTRPPRVLLSGSAVGFYGNRHDEVLDESALPGDDFLARVARDWEAATAPAAVVGTRVALLRTGIVLSRHGGALERLLPPFQLGVGGPIGNGRQWMSWISLEDELRAIEHALVTEAIAGPVNLVAPTPVTNADFATTLGRVLHRPALLPVPAFALQLLYGEMAGATLLAGQRAIPRSLLQSGFVFEHPTLESALRAELDQEHQFAAPQL